MRWAVVISPSLTTGRSSIAPTARIAAWGELMIAAKERIPNMPRFETVKVPPESSGGVILPSRTLAATLTGVLGDLGEALAIGVKDGGDHQGVLGGDGDADVDPRVELEAPVPIGAVGSRELLQGQGAGLDHHVVEGGDDSSLGGGGFQALASLDRGHMSIVASR